MKTRRFNEEVLFTTDEVARLRKDDVQDLVHQAESNQRQRIRLCGHQDVADAVHEMFIVHAKDTYVRPHKHLGKMESFHVIEGTVDVVVFDDQGGIAEVTSMGDYGSGKSFYHRISEPAYHTLLITSDVLVFHEITSGPFIREETLFAPWSPEESDSDAAANFMQELARTVGSTGSG